MPGAFQKVLEQMQTEDFVMTMRYGLEFTISRIIVTKYIIIAPVGVVWGGYNFKEFFNYREIETEKDLETQETLLQYVNQLLDEGILTTMMK